MKLKPSSESVADQIRRMGRTDLAAGVSREAGQEAWMPNSQARILWLEGWDGAKQQGFQQTTFDFGDTSCDTTTDQSRQ